MAQAIRYQRFACKSYLALDEDYIHRVEINELVKHNIGLISVGKKVKEIFKPELRVPTDLIMNYKVAEEIIKNICV
ncbi:hypothetical protein HMSSN036_87120 [Paenibacillus macerans]|nr:hypothetical protein HMSSN036_87120 [Paenibacillus macerans]